MSLIKKVTGRDLENIDAKFLTEFFSVERDESDIFELKSFYEKGQSNYKHKENAVIKTICGFLNSSGGVLIWGAPEGVMVEGNTEKVFTGALSPVDKNLGKDAFISKLANRIIPVPQRVRFHKVTIGENQYVYVFEVEESQTKPHQFDSRYYMRMDGQTKVAPHHYIDALFKQIRYPDLGGYIGFNELKVGRNGYELGIRVYIFNHSPLQNEENISFQLTVIRGTFQNIVSNERYSYFLDGCQLQYRDLTKTLHYGSPNYHSESIYISSRDLMATNQKVDFMLSFGGKHSPMKVSKYTLDLSSGRLTDNANKLISFKKENELMYDFGQTVGKTEEEKVDTILGRI